MSALFFDTETTGLANTKLPASDPSHPRIAQLAMILDDDLRVTRTEANFLILPDGWAIPAEAAKIHGISTEIATRFGVHSRWAMRLFCALSDRADELVAHNLDFDAFLIMAQLHRCGLEDQIAKLQAKKCFCTMKAATPLCKIPDPKGFSKYKWPNLQEAHVHLIGKGFEGAHDAMVDVRACRAVYYKLKDQNKPVT
jgi:DNA polymerase-3 subunit epsilon